MKDTKLYMAGLFKETKVITNFIPGDYFRKKIKVKAGKFVLLLILYHDDFKCGNALSSHAGTNSIGVIYASIPCILPQNVSRLSQIYTVLLFRSRDRTKFGNYPTFECSIDELNGRASYGIEIGVDGVIEKVFFEVGLITGDNLRLP